MLFVPLPGCPYTPDGLPLGLLPGVDNLYIAAGHEGDGIALSLLQGSLSELILWETSTLTEFAPDRFMQGKKQAASR